MTDRVCEDANEYMRDYNAFVKSGLIQEAEADKQARAKYEAYQRGVAQYDNRKDLIEDIEDEKMNLDADSVFDIKKVVAEVTASTVKYNKNSHPLELDDTKYLWDEDKHLKSTLDYIQNTYNQHYAGKNSVGETAIQFTEYFISQHDREENNAALKFNIGKYAMRYGKKDGFNKKDVYKAIHYLVMMLAYNDRVDSAKE